MIIGYAILPSLLKLDSAHHLIQCGLRGCGTEVAISLAAEGFGRTLCTAARSLSDIEFSAYLTQWRQDICSFLQENPRGTMNRRHPALAASLASTGVSFPSIQIIQLYLNPVRSSSEILSQNVNYDCHCPDIIAIAQLCELYFSWGTQESILPKFNNIILPALLMSVLFGEALPRDPSNICKIEVR